MGRFPDIDLVEHEDSNPAIQIFGRRYFKDQTPVEYLAEFLLVFCSPKKEDGSERFEFPIYASTPTEALSYFPKFRLGLKLFAFLGASKLETRHPVHVKSFRQGIAEIANRSVVLYGMNAGSAVRLIQGLFSGFVGVAGDRTWTAHTFLPASSGLLAREVLWKHAGQAGAARNLSSEDDWGDAWRYFTTSSHSFMARGGELLYLQLVNLFNSWGASSIAGTFEHGHHDAYQHLGSLKTLAALRQNLQENLCALLNDGDRAIGPLGEFVNRAFERVGISSEATNGPKEALLGWVPSQTAYEALLFAWEANNICEAQRGGLQKIALLRDLCVLHVMRSLCFQAARVSSCAETIGFVGRYSWIACSSGYDGNNSNNNSRKMAINSYETVEGMLYRALRVYDGYDKRWASSESRLDDGDDNVLRLFRKIGKQVGVVVPRKGQGMRMTLPPHIVRLLVAALVKPGERLRLDRFYKRIFAHYGLAIDQDYVSKSVGASNTQEDAKIFGVNASWFEEELRRGGYLIPLSDAVSLVSNPYKG